MITTIITLINLKIIIMRQMQLAKRNTVIIKGFIISLSLRYASFQMIFSISIYSTVTRVMLVKSQSHNFRDLCQHSQTFSFPKEQNSSHFFFFWHLRQLKIMCTCFLEPLIMMVLLFLMTVDDEGKEVSRKTEQTLHFNF